MLPASRRQVFRLEAGTTLLRFLPVDLLEPRSQRGAGVRLDFFEVVLERVDREDDLALGIEGDEYDGAQRGAAAQRVTDLKLVRLPVVDRQRVCRFACR